MNAIPLQWIIVAGVVIDVREAEQEVPLARNMAVHA